MFKIGHARHKGRSIPTYSTYPNYHELPLPAEPEAKIRCSPIQLVQSENTRQHGALRNGFFEGLLYMLPPSILLWAIIIWLFHTYLF